MILGITGSFGSGKTTVANIFKKYGFEVINADKLYHGIYKKNNALRSKIKKEFGTINRNKIKKIVFNDYKRLKNLNKITHPTIIEEIKKEISAIIKKYNNKNTTINKKDIINGKNYKKSINGKKQQNNIEKNKVKIIIDAPLLIEAKALDLVDKLIVVKCDEKTQIERLLKKGRHTKDEIINIINYQMPIEEKIKYADFVIDNNGSINEVEKQIDQIINSMQKP